MPNQDDQRRRADRKELQHEADSRIERQPFSKPQLTEYGAVADLTRGSSGTKGDAGVAKRP